MKEENDTKLGSIPDTVPLQTLHVGLPYYTTELSLWTRKRSAFFFTIEYYSSSSSEDVKFSKESKRL